MLVLHGLLGCGSLSLLTNELYVRSALHGQVSLAAVNHICVDHEDMNGCKTRNIRALLGVITSTI